MLDLWMDEKKLGTIFNDSLDTGERRRFRRSMRGVASTSSGAPPPSRESDREGVIRGKRGRGGEGGGGGVGFSVAVIYLIFVGVWFIIKHFYECGRVDASGTFHTRPTPGFPFCSIGDRPQLAIELRCRWGVENLYSALGNARVKYSTIFFVRRPRGSCRAPSLPSLEVATRQNKLTHWSCHTYASLPHTLLLLDWSPPFMRLA